MLSRFKAGIWRAGRGIAVAALPRRPGVVNVDRPDLPLVCPRASVGARPRACALLIGLDATRSELTIPHKEKDGLQFFRRKRAVQNDALWLDGAHE